MKHRFQWKKNIMAYVVAGVLCAAGGSVCTVDTAWAVPVAGVPAVDGVNVRESAVDGAIQDSIQSDRLVTISAETTGTDGKAWYQISYEKNGITIVGWVRSDLLDTSEEAVRAVQEAQTDPAGQDSPEDIVDEEGDQTQGIEVMMGSQKITLYDVPEEEALMISPDFTAAVCTFGSDSVTSYQLLSDRFVGSDANDYYYVYGEDALGDGGWYVYHTESETLQPCMINMQYEETQADAPQAAADSQDSMSKMLVAGLGLISLLLLILVIIFAVRCRMFRRYMEEDEEDFLDEPEPEEIQPRSRREQKKTEDQPIPVRTVIHEKVPAKQESDKLTVEDVYSQMLESQDLFTPEMSYSDSEPSGSRPLSQDTITNLTEETTGEYDFPVPEDADYDLKGDFTGRLPNEERQLEELLSLSLADDLFEETDGQNPNTSGEQLPEIEEPEFYDEEETVSDQKKKSFADDFEDLEFL